MLDTIRQAPLEELLALARDRFQVEFETVAVADEKLEILQIANMHEYVEGLANNVGDGPLELPFWAKIWPSSLLLAFFVDRLPRKNRHILEIGAGVGVTGLFAAKKGYQVVLSDIDENALLFARINILQNGLQDNADIAFVDFTRTELDRHFDYILGCEVLYREEMYRPMIKFLLKHLAATPDSEVIVALDYARRAKKFFQLAEKEFMMQSKTIGCKGGDNDSERHLCSIHRLKPRKQL